MIPIFKLGMACHWSYRAVSTIKCNVFGVGIMHHMYIILFQFGPVNPFKTQQMAAPRNMLSGYAEPAHINDFRFEEQRRTFHTYGKFQCIP